MAPIAEVKIVTASLCAGFILSRCIGRIAWKTLEVRDRRRVSDLGEMFAECLEHQRVATGDGRCLEDAPLRSHPQGILCFTPYP